MVANALLGIIGLLIPRSIGSNRISGYLLFGICQPIATLLMTVIVYKFISGYESDS